MIKKWFVAFTPLIGAILFPLLIPITIASSGLAYGLILALILTTAWFVLMLSTSEMPH